MREGRWQPGGRQAPSDYQRGLIDGQVDALEHILEAVNTPGADVGSLARALLKNARAMATEWGVQ